MGNFTAVISAINHWNWLEKYSSKILLKSPRPQWVNVLPNFFLTLYVTSYQLQQLRLRPSMGIVDMRQLKICATCFDISVGLLRVLEMIVSLVPELVTDWQQPSAELLLCRLFQVTCNSVLTLYMLIFFRGNIYKYIYIFCHYFILIWHRYLKSLLKWDQDLHILHSQYHGCWCPGDVRRQGISSHDIDLVKPR